MASLSCDVCGGILSVDAGGKTATCQFCGMQHSIERVREKVQEIKGIVSIEGNVSVSGIANTDSLLIRAQEFLDNRDFARAEEYYNRVLDNDPTSAEARDGIKKLEEISTVHVGATYKGKVDRIIPIGYFVTLYPSMKNGFIHISKLANKQVENVEEVVVVGDIVSVTVLGFDSRGRLALQKNV